MFVGCAQVVQLTGGQKDLYAPTIDSSKTYPLSGTTNFIENEVVIKFNEYIKLNNPNDNIIITPQFSQKPTYLAKNKTLKIKFNEPLKTNTTYVINFNGAVQDITEKNDSVFQYVFSTGNYMDSLFISGQITNAFTNKPIEKALVGVYPLDSCKSIRFDSIPFLVKPTYFTQSNKLGAYKINYLKPGDYYLFAFTDVNRNMLLNVDNENIGFWAEPIVLNHGIDSVNMKLFSVEDTSVTIKKFNFSFPGKVEVVFTHPPSVFKINSSVEMIKQETNRSDSLIYWLKQPPKEALTFYLTYNQKIDTLTPIYKQPKSSANSNLNKLTFKTNVKNGKLLPDENLVVSFTEPILKVDTSKIKFYDADSNQVFIRYSITNLLDVEFETKKNLVNLVFIDSNAFQSIYGHHTEQKQELYFENYVAEAYYGNILLTIDSIQEGSFIIELLDENQNRITMEKVNISTTFPIFFNDLTPGTYFIKLIDDKNYDQKWTTGSLIEKRQPEQIYFYESPIKLRSKWDTEIIWEIDLK
jgi:uncharacterized protein (DUF2141 family)